MRLVGVIAIVLVLFSPYVCAAGNYTGICFLDAILNGLDGLSTRINNVIHPTTSTTSTTETTTSTTESTTTTTEPETSTTKTTTTTSETTTTAFLGKCQSEKDCPQTQVAYTCDMDNNVLITTTNFICINPGPVSECKGRSTTRKHMPCIDNYKCVKGQSECVKT